MANIRDLFTRDHHEKVPPDLQNALTLLRLDGYQGLEDRLLDTDAFLHPWSVFRDSVYLLSPDAVPRTTQIIPIGGDPGGNGVSRLDILWFYTQFDEGTLRYDPRADRYNIDHTTDTSLYGVIDKSKWRIEEHEKHLYAWLLQEFKVGKSYNPWRFECLELKNVCTVWEEIFIPIVNAVRTSYSSKGRRHYGRLALFIEARCPSALAFPGSNVAVPEGGVLSPTPYRLVSIPKKTANTAGATPYYAQEFAQGVLTAKNYDTTERELRDVYPQYGGLVERPKFKQKMEDWLTEQRARAERRKGLGNHGRVNSFQPSIRSRNGSGSPVKRSPQGSVPRRQDLHKRSASGVGDGGSPIKQYSESLKRTLTNAVSSLRGGDQRSPLHGVTRQLHFPDRNSSQPYDPLRDSMRITPLPRPQQHRETSGVSVFTSIRNSNPFIEDLADQIKRARGDSDDSVFSPMGQLSAIPRPLQPEADEVRSFKPYLEESPEIRGRKSYHDVRVPSYEGSEWEKEISLTDLHVRRMNTMRNPEPARTRTPATRLPAPILPIPYSGPRVASADTPGQSKFQLPQTVLPPPKLVSMPVQPGTAAQKVAWPGPPSTLPKAVPWPNTPSPKARKSSWKFLHSDSEHVHIPPPIPAKSPERQIRNPRSRQREDPDHEMLRIVSRENIRNALGDLSHESSCEELAPPKAVLDPAHAISPVKQQLRTFNSHLFPRKDERKGTPVGEWVKGEVENSRCNPGGAYEMDVLNGGEKD
ncbi:hypothetical protein HBI70_095330 [Parastagonospora nodorum]|nr:hypothetical protein HBI70_095330 [Parastagonospora nodorum]